MFACIWLSVTGGSGSPRPPGPGRLAVSAVLMPIHPQQLNSTQTTVGPTLRAKMCEGIAGYALRVH